MVLFLVVLLLAGCASHPPAQKPAQKALPWKWAEENLQVMYPEKPRSDCIARDPAGNLVPCDFSNPEVRRRLEAPESAFRDKQYEIAEAGYADLLQRFPRDYETLLDWGDAALFMGHGGDALARYRRARDANPEDFRAYWYSARALLQLGRNEEALAAYAHAFALNPRHQNLVVTAGHDMERIGYVLRSDHFVPLARVAGGDISIGAQDARWLAWGLCKRAYEIDDYRRKKHVPEPVGEFSLTEERDCIDTLLAVDRDLKDPPPADPVILRLRDIARAGLLDGFIDYELGTRSLPYLANQNPAAAAEMEKFVRHFVLVPKG